MLSRKWRWLVSCNLILKPECHTDQAASGGSLSCSFNMLSCPASSNRATSSVPNIQLLRSIQHMPDAMCRKS
ncbi:hypothetical protein SCA6_012368 [Theobroma cacao]